MGVWIKLLTTHKLGTAHFVQSIRLILVSVMRQIAAQYFDHFVFAIRFVEFGTGHCDVFVFSHLVSCTVPYCFFALLCFGHNPIYVERSGFVFQFLWSNIIDVQIKRLAMKIVYPVLCREV